MAGAELLEERGRPDAGGDAGRGGTRLREALRAALPGPALAGYRSARTLWRELEIERTRRIFERAESTPVHLDREALEALDATSPAPPPYTYDAGSNEQRGALRAGEILGLVPREADRFLEVGAWDAMTSRALRQAGKHAVAVDVRKSGFDPRAEHAGVLFHEMDAAALGFADESFDVVFSYNSFEHFRDPAATLEELLRVTRPGGHLFLSFAPLYGSAWGQHVWSTVRVPYCQFLFSRDTLDAFTRERGLEPIDWSHVNGWSLARYRALWERFASRLTKVHYAEGRNSTQLEAIRRHPSCFRSQVDDFEELLVASIKVLFRRA